MSRHRGGLAYSRAKTSVTITPKVLTSSKKILWVGSSSEAARACGTGTMFMDGARPLGYLMQAAAQLAANGVNTNTQSWFGDQSNDNPTGTFSAANMIAYDSRITLATGCIVNTTNSSMGGYNLRFPSATTCDFRITTTEPVTDITIYLNFTNTTTTNNRLLISTDGGTEATVLPQGNTAIKKYVISGLTSATHSIRIRVPSSPQNVANINLLGMEMLNNGAPQITFIPCGARGWDTSTTYWTRGGGIYAPLSVLAAMNCDVVIASFGGNETLSTTANYTAFQARCQTWGDTVVSAGGTPIFVAKPYMSAQYYAVINALNAIYTPALATYMMGTTKSQAQVIADGEQAPDATHYLAPFHAREGAALGNWLYNTALPSFGILA